MTVTTSVNKIIYPGNGSTTAFPFAFATPGASDIEVFFTDISGNVTQLTQGPGTSQYQITINPVSGTNPTPVGGTVTYNPSGIPIPLNTSLTILRVLPLVQATSLANQGTLYQPVEEAALDYQMMTSQQIQEAQGRALTVAVSDPVPANLPAVAARANLFLAFDSSGNPIASQPGGSNTPVSSAMVPVVTAASLSAAQTAMGLGNVAPTNTGVGLAIAAGQLNVLSSVIADTTNQTVDASFHHEVRAATGALTYALNKASTLPQGFGFTVLALTAAITFTVNAADKFSGGSTGTSMIVPPGSQAFVTTDGVSTWYLVLSNAPGSIDPARNLQINASVASNALTIALKDRNGNDPSTASPVILAFRDSTVTNGDPVIRALTGPLSITVPSGGTLGTVNNQASRIWVGLFDNAGTVVLGVYNALSAGTISIVSWDETSTASPSAVGAGSTSAQTWYAASSLTSKSLRILGFVESAQATAGTWASAPTKVQLFGPGIKKPGDVVQEIATPITSADSTASATFVALTNNRISITPNSAANVIRVDAQGIIGTGGQTGVGVASTGGIILSRGVVANTNLIGNFAQLTYNSAGSATIIVGVPAAVFGYDLPSTTSAVTYAVQGRYPSGTGSLTYGGSTIISAKEIMA